MHKDDSTTAVDTQGTYVVALAERPQIVCPSWCTVSEDTHLAELAQQEGNLEHRNSWQLSEHNSVELWSGSTVDGTPNLSPQVVLNFKNSDLDMDETRKLHALLGAVTGVVDRD